MKLFTLTLIFFFTHQQPDIQKRAQQSVNNYLKSSFEDASMYTPGKWGKVEKFFTSFEMTGNYQFSMRLINDKKELAKSYRDSDQKQAREIMTEVQNSLNKLDAQAKKYNPRQYGWKIYHQYDAPNRLGNIISFGKVFYMDTQFHIVNPDTLMVNAE